VISVSVVEKSTHVRVRKELEVLIRGFAEKHGMQPHIVRYLAIHFGLADLLKLVESGVKTEELKALYKDLTTPKTARVLGLSKELSKIYETLESKRVR